MSKGRTPTVEPLEEVAPAKIPFVIQTAAVDQLGSVSKITKYGKLVGAQAITITSKVSGRVDSIEARPGEHIEKGETLVVLEDSNSTATFQQQRAKLQLATARNSYSLTLNQVNQAITDAQNALSQAESQYNAIRQQGGSTAALQIDQIEAQTNKAQLDYQTLVTSNQQTIQNFISTAKNIAKEIELLYFDITINADQLLGVSDLYEQSNDYFENSLGAQNTSTRREAQSELRLLLTQQDLFTQT